MDRITKLGQAILEALDTQEHGTGDTEILEVLLFGARFVALTVWFDTETILASLVNLLDAGLISARFRENPLDMGCTAEPIIYSITEAGCAALWALQKADQAARPVRFESRAAMREYMQGIAA